MEQILIRRLKDWTLAEWRQAAQQNGRSLEAELRDLIERERPIRKKALRLWGRSRGGCAR